MSVVELKARELTEEEFSGYGKIMDCDFVSDCYEEGDFKFYYDLVEVDFKDPVAISMVNSKLQDDLYGNSLETHFKSPEVLIPLDGTIYVVLTKTDPNDNTRPDLSTAKAFVVKPGQGIMLYSGTWHRAPLSKDVSVKTCCLVRKGTPDDNITYYLERDYGFKYKVVV